MKHRNKHYFSPLFCSCWYSVVFNQKSCYSLSQSSLEANKGEWCCLWVTCFHRTSKQMMFGRFWCEGNVLTQNTRSSYLKQKKNPYQHILLPSEREKKKREWKNQADCLNHRLPSVSEAHRHTLCTNIWSYPQTHRYSPPSPLPLLPSLLTGVVCGLCIVGTDTIACLGTHGSQHWHTHTGGCAHDSPGQDGNNTLRGSKKPPHSPVLVLLDISNGTTQETWKEFSKHKEHFMSLVLSW